MGSTLHPTPPAPWATVPRASATPAAERPAPTLRALLELARHAARNGQGVDATVSGRLAGLIATAQGDGQLDQEGRMPLGP